MSAGPNTEDRLASCVDSVKTLRVTLSDEQSGASRPKAFDLAALDVLDVGQGRRRPLTRELLYARAACFLIAAGFSV